ncbi:MAG: hypothetical protein HYS27_26170 [Deltaproteobacteria bacterium]|nr:hypothetical protein [Deltaproteobacteria bacterium]
MPTTRFSRHALPPTGRLRHRPDLGVAPAVLATGALVLALWVDSALAAGPRGAVLTVAEGTDLDVVVSVEAASAPTFQVFRVPGQPRYAVELPGVAFDGAPLVTGENILLLDAALEPASKSGPQRLVLSFSADVDYDATTRGAALEVRFSHHGDKAALVAAARDRKERAAVIARAAQTANERAAAEAKMRADEAERGARAAEQSRLAALAARENAERERLAALEKKRQEDEQRALAKQRAEQDRLAALEKKRQEEEAARLAAAEAKKKADQEKKDALERKRQEEEAVRLAAIEAKKKADEERKAALDKKRQEEEAARLAAIEAKKKADEERKAALEKKRQDEEAARLAAIEAKKKADEEKKAAIEKKRKEEEAARLAAALARQQADDEKKAAIEKKRKEEEAARLAAEETKSRAEADRRAAELRRQQEAHQRAEAEAAAKAEREREAARRAEEEQRRAEAEAAQRAAAAKQAEELAKKERARAEDLARRGAEERAPLASTRSSSSEVSTAVADRDGAPAGFGFGGRSIEIGPPTRYQRYQLGEGDEFGGGDEELDEAEGRGLLSKVTVQRTADGSRVGVRVDGGARYDLRRRGKSQLVLTLFDTRAENLNVRRVLDARSLETSVVRVLPSVEEDARFRVELLIELRDQAPVRIGQGDGMLWLDVGNG